MFQAFTQKMPGWTWFVINSLFACIMGMLTKELAVYRGVPIIWIIFSRYSLGILGMSLPSLAGAWSLKVRNRGVFLLRGIFGSVSQFFFFFSIVNVGLGRGTVLFNLVSLFAAISGIFILGEKPKTIVALAVLGGTIGVWLCFNLSLPRSAEWLTLLGAFIGGISLSLIRRLRRTDSNQVTFLSHSFFGCIIFLIPALLTPPPREAGIWMLILLLSLADILALLSLQQGLSKTPIAVGAALITMTPIASLLIGFLMFDERLLIVQWMGSILVLASAILATASTSRAMRRKPR